MAKRLSRETERNLILRAQAGDNHACQMLLDAHEAFVAQIAKRLYKPKGAYSFDDFMQDGKIGLMQAIRKYDFSSDANLLTFAFWKIRAEIQHSYRKGSDTIKLPSHIRKWRRQYHHWLIKNRLSNCQISMDQFIKHQKLTRRQAELFIHSFNIHVISDNEDNFLNNEIASKEIDPIEKCENKLRARKLIERIADSRSRDIFKMRFGIDYDKPHTLIEIGERYGITKERVRQLCDRTIRELQQSIA